MDGMLMANVTRYALIFSPFFHVANSIVW
jgi:hypothetical protein